MMKMIQIFTVSLLLLLSACKPVQTTAAPEKVIGQLKIGFDIDDTVLFSRDNFIIAQDMSDTPGKLDYGWINSHDSLYSVTIEPIAELIGYFRAQGHLVYFITARPGDNGEAVGRHLSRELGFPIVKGDNLFFAEKETDPISGNRYTTKHRVIEKLGLHLFFGDADSDMVAASVAGIRGVRVVRDPRSVIAYSRNYFGDTISDSTQAAPFSEKDYQRFLSGGVGPYGETIYPIK